MAISKWVGVVLLVIASAGSGSNQDRFSEIRRLLTAADYAAAESGARALVADLERTRPDSLDLAQSLDLLVQALVEGGKPADPAALPTATRAVALKEKLAGPDDPAVAVSLANLGLVLRRQGKLDDARAAYERALNIREKAYGPDDPQLASVIAALSALASNAGDFPRARDLGERAVRLAEHGADPISQAVAANNLALALFQLNDYDGSRNRLEQALAAYERALGPEHPEVGKTLSNLANVVSESGDLVEARRLYDRAIAIQEKRQGRDHPDVALNVNNLADVFYMLGDFETSAALFERALRALEGAYGPQHTRVAMVLGNLAQVRAAQGKSAESRSLYLRALAVREKAVGADHPSLVYPLSGFAQLSADLGEREAARPLFNRALAIAERAFGADHPATALVWQGLGELDLHANKLADAERSIARALQIRLDLLGPDHPLVAESRATLALVHAKLGRTAAALDAALEAERVSRAHLQVTAQGLAERHALSYAVSRVSGADIALSLLASKSVTDPDAVRKVWDSVVRSRALVLEEMAWRQRLAATTTDPTVTRLAQNLAAMRQRVAGLLVRHAADPASRVRIVEALAARDAAERALAEQSGEFRSGQAQGRIGIGEVSSQLAPSAALVAFVKYRGSTTGVAAGGPRDEYLAFVMRGGANRAVAVRVGDAKAVDDLIQQWRAAIATEIDSGRPTARSERVHGVTGSAIRRLLWDPIVPSLAAASEIFIVPTGPLHLVNWGTLPDGKGRYLVERPQLIHYLSAERDLTRATRQDSRGLLLVDNPAYGAASSQHTSAARRPVPNAKCAGLSSVSFDPLPATRQEGDSIAALWRSVHSADDSRRLTGVAATEAEVRHRIAGARVVHFATHGFFLGAWCGPGATTAPARQPLLVAGLALAGANSRGGRAPADDGLLLAEEILTLDLRAAEWTVLSACDTGTGLVAAGEELFGLRRAFQIAGARTVIVSLWPVDDQTTREWMDTAYRSHFGAGDSTAASVRAATVRAIRSRRSRGMSTHPAYWGAFVATGGI